MTTKDQNSKPDGQAQADFMNWMMKAREGARLEEEANRKKLFGGMKGPVIPHPESPKDTKVR